MKHSSGYQGEQSCNNFYNRLCELNVLELQPAENPQLFCRIEQTPFFILS